MYLSGNDGNNISENKLRDLYNREKALENWTNKVNTQLKEPDRSDVLMLVEHLKEQEKDLDIKQELRKGNRVNILYDSSKQLT